MCVLVAKYEEEDTFVCTAYSYSVCVCACTRICV